MVVAPSSSGRAPWLPWKQRSRPLGAPLLLLKQDRPVARCIPPPPRAGQGHVPGRIRRRPVVVAVPSTPWAVRLVVAETKPHHTAREDHESRPGAPSNRRNWHDEEIGEISTSLNCLLCSHNMFPIKKWHNHRPLFVSNIWHQNNELSEFAMLAKKYHARTTQILTNVPWS